MKMRGFTLIEMIATIVIGSIMMLGIAGYVKLGMKGYADSIDRQRIQTQAQFVLEKMSREIRHAVPNSFYEPSSNCLAFVPIEFSGFYNLRDGNLEFLLGNDIDRETMPKDSWLVVNPSRIEDLLPASPQSFSVSELTKKDGVFTISGAADSIDSSSISSRHYIYQENSQVSYCFDNDQITRNGVTVAENVNVAKSKMHYKEPTLQRGGLVHINLEFERDGERSVYQQDVQVLNVP
ncbi:prepilin-type N-terminal cleavage/methylation domain-containing protein [Vibrio alfacsensis]|uniref:PilW family protein n=1 Tax=Vibrio alfacsensis TaxID=1074311 RepID=UPI002ADE618A|nr:prepilin-type N-terminal cleavage/methylation domain-containing protein [Vibrio alfacsensis]WQE75902.1 prepilin-type N-terminal cleavage/methylation domain-containing protein [Vibrio alfacsensis]